jgi:hypothetical protein
MVGVMGEVTITKEEYKALTEKARRYEYLRVLIEEDAFQPPPTKSAASIRRQMAKTGKYSEAFLASVENGLKKPNYFKS